MYAGESYDIGIQVYPEIENVHKGVYIRDEVENWNQRW